MNFVRNKYIKYTLLFLVVVVIPAFLGVYFAYSPGSSSESTSNLKEKRSQTKDKQKDPLKGLGYLSGSEEMPDKTGVLQLKEEMMYGGRNLFCGGQGPEAYLMDNDGTILHKWRYPWSKAYDDYPQHRKKFSNNPRSKFWRNCFVLKDGSLIAIFGGLGIIKIDANSELIWSQPIRAHHDIWRQNSSRPGGPIYVMDRKITKLDIQGKSKDVIVEDLIKKYDGNGELLRGQSIVSAIIESDYQSLLANTSLRSGGGMSFKPNFGLRTKDALHTNSIQVIEPDRDLVKRVSSHPDQKHALISARQLDSLLLISLQANRVEWILSKQFQAQHDATLLPNGNILLFDNVGNHRFTRKDEGSLRYEGTDSRVLEIDPKSQDVVWKYAGRESKHFSSICCSLVQRLPNGNTLITETQKGRAFEITRQGELVWEYRNPYSAARDKNQMAWLFKMRRIPKDFPDGWYRED